MTRIILSLAACLSLFLSGPSLAKAVEQEILTLSRVMELAAGTAPQVRLSTTRVEESEARLAGARVRTLEDPALDLGVGRRNGEELSTDLEVGLELPVEFWGRREKRVALARADLDKERYLAEDVRRQAVSKAVAAYFRLLQARERFTLAQGRWSLAEEVLRIAEERLQAGDAPKFEVNLAKTELARAASEIAAAQGQVARARASLAQSLGFSAGAPFEIKGDLDDRHYFDAVLQEPLDPKRPELLAARAEVEASEAAVALAQAEQRPDVGLGLSFKREGDEEVVMAGVRFSLPFFNPRNEGPILEAKAQKRRAEILAETTRQEIATDIEGSSLAYEAAVEAARRMENEALPLQEENERMARESYRAGKINLATLLQVRREALETRTEYLERLLEAAEAGMSLASAVGAFFGTQPTTYQ